MQISFTKRKLSDLCNSRAKATNEYGKRQAEKIMLRIAQLDAASDMSEIPEAARCHPLHGKKEGSYAVDLVHPYRLVFKPDHDPLPESPGGGLDIKRVTEVIVCEIIDYH
jgi:proteic killer suppression protein